MPILYSLRSGTEILARQVELMKLTIDVRESDMKRLLDDLVRGEDPLVAAVTAEDEGVIVGWATGDFFVSHFFRPHRIIASVFVAPSHRRRGIATCLVTQLLEEIGHSHPGMIPEVDVNPFWNRFPVAQGPMSSSALILAE